jgi:hypothetical protein
VKPDRIEARQAGNGPLSGSERAVTGLNAGLNAISADEFKQFTAVEVPERYPGFRPLLPGAALNAIDPSADVPLRSGEEKPE